MRTIRAATVAFTAMLLPMLQVAPAWAVTFNKTYVSNTGSNANNCSTVVQACASFATALASTAPGGEITVVNTGDYGAVNIVQSVNVTNDGAGEASILAAASTGIIVSAGVGDVVSIRGLVIDGQDSGLEGISIGQISAVHIQNCVIRNFQASGSGVGIGFFPTGNSQLFMSDAIIFNNGTAGTTGGIRIEPEVTGSATVVLHRVHLENNVVGLFVNGTLSTGNGAHVIIRDSVVSGNAGDGILAMSAPGQATAFLVVERTSSVNNGGTGIHAEIGRAHV